MAGELVEEEGDGRCGRVVAGEEQRQHLVADLLVGEADPLGVGRLEEHAEDVLARAAASPPRDLVEDDPVQHPPHPAQAGERATRPADDLEPVLALVEAEATLERRRDVDAAALGIEAEQGLHRDPHRDVARPVVEVDPGALPPLAKPRVRLGRHGRRRRGDPLAVEGGHHQLPRAVVVGAVGGEEAVADERDQVAKAAVAPAELLAIGHQDEPVRLRPDHEDDQGVEDSEREDRPVLLVGR